MLPIVKTVPTAQDARLQIRSPLQFLNIPLTATSVLTAKDVPELTKEDSDLTVVKANSVKINLQEVPQEDLEEEFLFSENLLLKLMKTKKSDCLINSRYFILIWIIFF